jgi:outer membrane usher protein
MAASIVLIALFSPCRPADADDGTTLLLDVVVNGFPTGLVGEFVQRKDGLYAPAGELRNIGFRVPASAEAEPQDLIELSTLPGLILRLDEPSQTLYVTAGNDALLPKLLQARQGRSDNDKIPVESGTGASLNYDVVASRTGTDNLATGTFDLRGFSPYGVLSSGLLAYRDPGYDGTPGPYTTVRLDSAYTFSDPDAMMRYRAGDFINDGLSWTRPVRLGGAQVKSDFALRPDLVTMPLPLVSGTVAVPSTVDVLVNGDRVFSQQVQPGPFQIPQLPVVSGASTISMAVTNALGQQVVQTLPFYGSAGLLAPGLQSFTVETGAVRRNWGIESNDYGPPAASGSWRRGLTSWFTAEGHAEGTTHLGMAGGGGVVNVFNLGVLNFSAAGSSNSGSPGAQAQIGVSRASGPWSFGASATKATPNFSDIAAINGDPVPTLQLNGSAGLSLGPIGSLGLAYNGIDRPSTLTQSTLPTSPSQPGGLVFLQPAQHAHIVSASYMVQVSNVSIYATGFHDFSNGSDTGVLMGFTVPLGSHGAVSAGAGTGSSGAYGQLQANQSATEVGDWGYQAYASEGAQPHQFGEVQYKSPWALISAGADHESDQTALRTEAQGALSLVGGGLFASNTIDDAFAVVKTGIANVHVLSEHRVVGQTDSDGELFVPDLRSFEINHLEIDPLDVPADASIAYATRDVRPQDRSGVVVDFPIRTSHGALLRLVDESGTPLPVGGAATLAATGAKVPVGYDGEAYVVDLQAHNELTVEQKDGKRCTAAFDYHPMAGDIPTIGPLTCREEQP